MAMVWIEDLSNLHCPTCDSRLVQQAGRFDPIGRSEPLYTADGNQPAVCPAGHDLPSVDQLVSYRDSRGYADHDEPVREVRPPR